MQKNKVLFQIKNLEKKVARYLLNDEEFSKSCKNFSKPSPTQLQIIDYLLKNMDRVVYQRELEELFTLKRATVSGVLKTMEKNGLIFRMVDEKDTRAKKILLNDSTKAIFLQAKKKVDDLEKILVQGLSKEEIDTFQVVLEKMERNLTEENNKK